MVIDKIIDKYLTEVSQNTKDEIEACWKKIENIIKTKFKSSTAIYDFSLSDDNKYLELRQKYSAKKMREFPLSDIGMSSTPKDLLLVKAAVNANAVFIN